MSKFAGKLSWFTLCMLIRVAATAQVKSLNIGDYISGVQIERISNFGETSAKVSDFKGKLLILDFWATWCAPCVSEFPKLARLQAKFGNALQILSISDEPQPKVVQFIENMQKVNGLRPVVISGDTILNLMFPHTYLPHYVWIDARGKIIAFTGAEDVNETKIGDFLNKGNLNVAVKEDDAVEFVNEAIENRPVFMPSILIKKGNEVSIQRISDSSLFIHTTLTKYNKEINFSGTASPDSTLFSGWNKTIMGLYNIAFWHQSVQTLNSGNTILEVEDSALYGQICGQTKTGARLFAPGREFLNWIKIYGYCYEIKVPPILSRQLYDIMLEELNRYFGALYGIEGVKVMRSRKYLALEQVGDVQKFQTKQATSSVQQNEFSLKLNSMRLSSLLFYLAIPLQKYPPIIDETDFKGKVDLEINCQLSDLKALNQALLKYGLRLSEKEKVVEVGLIRDIQAPRN